MMLPLALFVLVCTLGHATSSAIPRAGRPGNDDTKVSKVVPPPIGDAALMARFIVNQADWTAVATISTRKDVPTFPVANVIALSDGALEKGSGVPYMFMTPLDYTAKDLAADNRATLLMTLAQGDYCKDKVYDPMDPRCARVMITGRIVEVKDDSELAVAKSAMFGRHPWLAHMPENHHFFFAKIDIATVVVLDTFGGPKYVTPEEYYNANPKPAAIGRPGRPFFAKPLTKGTDNDYPEPKFVYRV